MGIEPTQPAWKAGALPLSYTRKKNQLKNNWGKQDSNLRRLRHQIYSLAHLAALELQQHQGRNRPNPREFKRISPQASGGTRTHNLRFTKPELCQLSYASGWPTSAKVVEYIIPLPVCKGDSADHETRTSVHQADGPRIVLRHDPSDIDSHCSYEVRRAMLASCSGLAANDAFLSPEIGWFYACQARETSGFSGKLGKAWGASPRRHSACFTPLRPHLRSWGTPK